MCRTLSCLVAVTLLTAAAVSPAAPVRTEIRLAHTEPHAGCEEFTLDGHPFFLETAVLLDQTAFAAATARPAEGDTWLVDVTLTPAGTRRFADLTAKHVNDRLGMVVDGKLLTAPVVRAPITEGRVLITGHLSGEEARRIAAGVVAGH